METTNNIPVVSPETKLIENELYMNALAQNIVNLDAKITALTNILITNGLVSEPNCNLITSLILETKVYKDSMEALHKESEEIKVRLESSRQTIEVKQPVQVK